MSELFDEVCEIVKRENAKVLNGFPLPCPFCGGALVKRGAWPLYDHNNPGCILDGSTVSEKHLSQWNARPEPTATA